MQKKRLFYEAPRITVGEMVTMGIICQSFQSSSKNEDYEDGNTSDWYD